MAEAAHPLAGLLPDLLHPDNARRAAAEQRYRVFGDECPDDLLTALLSLATSASASPAISPMAAVLLRQAVGDASQPSVYRRSRPETQQAFQQQLLRCVALPLPPAVRRPVASALARLGSPHSGADWPAVLPALLQALRSAPPGPAHAAALLALAELVPALPEAALAPHLDSLRRTLEQALGDASAEVPATACEVLAALAQALHTPSLLWPFGPALTMLIRLLESPWDGQHASPHLPRVLAALQDTLEANPAFVLAQQAGPLLAALARGLQGTEDEALHHTALECLVSAVEAIPGDLDHVLAVGPFLAAVLPLALRPVLHTDACDAYPADELADPPELELAGEAVDRLATAVGGEAMVPVALQAVAQLLAGSGAPQGHRGVCGALLIVKEMTEGCADCLGEDLTPVQQLLGGAIAPALGHGHPRVRDLALQCIAQFATHVAPDFPAACAPAVLPVVCHALEDSSERVAAQAALTLARLLVGAPPASLQPHGPAVVEALLAALARRPATAASANAWTALCALVQCLPGLAAQNYDRILQAVRATLAAAPPGPRDRQAQAGRGRAMLCAAHVGDAVGRGRFHEDGLQLLQVFQRLATHLESGDPQGPSLHRSAARIAALLGAPCLPVVGPVVQELLGRLATVDQGVEFSTAPPGDPSDARAEVALFRVAGQADQYVTVHTGVLDERCEDLATLQVYFAGLGPHLRPALPAAIAAAAPLLTFKFHTRLRLLAAQLLGDLVAALPAPLGDGERAVLVAALPALLDAVGLEPVPAVQAAVLRCAGAALATDVPISPDALAALAEALHRGLAAQVAAHQHCAGTGCVATAAAEEEDEDEGATNPHTPLADFVRVAFTHRPAFVPYYRRQLLPAALQAVADRHCHARRLALQVMLPYLELGGEDVIATGLPLVRQFSTLLGPGSPVAALGGRCLAALAGTALAAGALVAQSVVPALMSVSAALVAAAAQPPTDPLALERGTWCTLALVRLHRAGDLVLVPAVADDLLRTILTVVTRLDSLKCPADGAVARAWREIHGYVRVLTQRPHPITAAVDWDAALWSRLRTAPHLQPEP